MTERTSSATPEQTAWLAESTRLNKIIQALMNRAERNASAQSSDFGVFQRTLLLEQQVTARTGELEAALRDNEKTNRALRESEAKFRGLVDQSLVGIVLIELGKFVYSNAKFDEIFGYSAAEIRELGPVQTAAPCDRALVAEKVRLRMDGEIDHLEYTFRGLRKNGDIIDIECHSSAMQVGSGRLVTSLVMDITERTRAATEVRALQEMLRDQSTHDALTGLYNRRFLEESFGREVILAERAQYPLSVVMADLDHFKAVNDRDGHLAGDAVLRVFGGLLKDSARASDIVCRYGGEEFLLVFPHMTREQAAGRAEELRRRLAATEVHHGTARIAVTASFGVASFPLDGRTCDELVAAADHALYAAKTAGRNRVNAVPPGGRTPNLHLV